MKIALLAGFLLLIMPVISFCQNIGMGTTLPHTSSALDITSTTKGLLIPRMTSPGITAIANPAKGLMVYDSALNQLMVNMGTPSTPNWQTIVANSAWGLTGNRGIDTSRQFLGTTDAQPLILKANNFRSGLIDISGVANTSFGYKSLTANTTGFYNTALGSTALINNPSGERNTSVGPYTMVANTTGSFNTAVGLYALASNIDGGSNTAAGVNALQANSNGNFNAAYGVNSLYANIVGSENCAIGYQALFNNSTGHSNVAIGSNALASNTVGDGNNAYGTKALFSNVSGIANIAMGDSALYSNISGYGNTALSYKSLWSNTAGSGNIAISGLLQNITGNYNVGIGDNALGGNSTGSANVAIGEHTGAGGIFYNHNNCVFIGSNATAIDLNNPPLSGFENATAIGANAYVLGSNQIRLGDYHITSISGNVNWSTISDGRYKKNIKEDVKGLEFIMKLRPVTYNLNIQALDQKFQKDDSGKMNMSAKTAPTEKENIIQTGFVAQEVEQAAVATGYKFSGVDKPKTDAGLYGLRYSEFVVPLVKAIQEQQQMIEALKKENQLQKEANVQMQNQIDELKTLIKK